ncbi:LRR_1 domain-containing protein/Pkinase_Tyr domain-containing protein/LRRNT_2 domain-containing protein/LRR_8 domain-containing protein [Cephalotus follicularis]|uniref:LRR_1 domain-containing protein/Pkinase_Tyr domain-containing protein/LRRNT_2 domain-containing protein/LRR_8 domain-containing protein n=1 Tax=Cephalotus follicularis TaxID=3775 RepID=A0A1Q3BE04_CEPFO|nr:LRR_1 domain-containing protein/Pkinase_Tyr domain-containing protein/LRRNT_2 domain-containing protein/LRR_8 domain-containing protein [Cephalotus follicularis]
MRKDMNLLFILYAILLFGAILSPNIADPVQDKQALLDFINNISYSRSLNWTENSNICTSWTGVTCNNDHTRIISLRLPGIGLLGTIPPNTLSRLSAIQTLSLRSNAINGPFPSDFSKLENLTQLYLQFNEFSGDLPAFFSVWKNLNVIDLSNNGFTGSIPTSISNLTHLSALSLANNLLSGEIPDLNVPSLEKLDLSNNSFTGSVPKSLQRFPVEAFAGNNLSSEIAFPPALPIQPPNAQPTRETTKTKLGEPAILGIAIGGCAFGFVVIVVLMVICYSPKESEDGLPVKSPKKKEGSLKIKRVPESKETKGSVVFFEGCNLVFDLEDLLRASAEVLGKGLFGTTYKAALEDGTTVAVKRLKEVSVAKREFEQQMELIGGIRHENVTPLRAYYYSKDEKLMVYDYYEQGCVSAMFHGNRGEGRNPLDWETRLAIGAARGIAHIHTQSGGKLVHGNIKAANIFLNSQGYGCVSEMGLATLMSQIPQPAMRVAGYRATEVTDSRKATHASDVYSFGVLVLELLTGKSPIHATGGEEVVHLVRWVNSVVREEWTAEVFDVELLRYPNIEEELVEMLQIGMACTVRMPEQRPNMPDVVKMVEDVRRVNQPLSQNNSEISFSTPTPVAAEVGHSSAQQ